MSTVHDLIVAVFDDSAMAEHAIKDLKNTGLSNDEILYSSRHGKGGIFENLKGWVTGEETASIGDVAKKLKDMGVPEDAANYYARERDAGHPIVAVNSPSHEQDARNVLLRHGGYSHVPGNAPADMGSGTRPSPAYDQSARTTGSQSPDQPIPHVQGEQRVSGTVRREEPRIEKSGDVNIRRDEGMRQGRRDEDTRSSRRDEDIRPEQI